jgi:hypothetical protein
MKSFVVVLLRLIFLAIILAGVGIAFVVVGMPRVKLPTITVAPSPTMASRGAYLFYHVCACVSCHSTRDQTRLSMPVVPGSEGSGGDIFDESTGMPGVVYGRNLTPTALSSWSDAELVRAITAGVDRHGNAIFPLMPYQHYAMASEQDISAIISYLRTLKPIDHEVPPRHLTFPMNVIVNLIPKPAELATTQPVEGTAAYGTYLLNLGACLHCHSVDHHGEIPTGMQFAGGKSFPIPSGTVRSANLTPDATTGLGGWTKERFIAAFTAYRMPSGTIPVATGQFNTPMPWSEYAGMTNADLGAIYDALHALPAVSNAVVKFTPAAEMPPTAPPAMAPAQPAAPVQPVK